MVSSQGKHLIHLADAVGHPVLMEHPSWVWAYDFMPPAAQQAKNQLLNCAVELDALVFGSHLPFPGIGRVYRQDDGWRWKPMA